MRPGPCHRQAQHHHHHLLQQSPASHRPHRTTSLLHLLSRMLRILTLVVCVSPNSNLPQHHLHHQNLTHTTSLHHRLCQTMFLHLHLHRLHHLRPPLAHLARQSQAPPHTTTLQSPLLQSATPMPRSLRRPSALSNHPPNPLTPLTNPNTRSARQSVLR